MHFKNALFLFMTLSLSLSLSLLGTSHAFAQTANKSKDKDIQHHVTLTLSPEVSPIEPGMPVMVALKQELEDGWHSYWRNAGDSGEPPRIQWTLPAGFEAATLLWPVPKNITMPPLTNYGYEGEATLLQEIRTPSSLPEGPIEIDAAIDILVCKDICIPEHHEISTRLNNGTQINNSALINAAFNKLPVDVNWGAKYRTNEQGDFVIALAFDMPGLITNGNEDVRFDILPYEWGIVENSSKTFIRLQKNKSELVLRKKHGGRSLEPLDEITALIAYDIKGKERGALEIKAYPDSAWLAALKTKERPVIEAPSRLPEAKQPQINFVQALLFALLGGFVLNLMPCVFPILSMKALSLVQMAHKSPVSAKRHGLSYTAGVLVSFGIIAGVLIGLQSAGAQIGWGFQMQNPIVVLLLSYLLFMVGLNLSGFYEIKGSFTNIAAGLGQKEGVLASFFTGILAALVATPCTAPFMGVAMGFALTQPAMIALSVFLALGMGLALPYLLLSFFPTLRAFLPKPGHWMVLFREFLAFPIYASAVWLIWVYSQQTGNMALFYALTGFVSLSFAVWIFRQSSAATPRHLFMKSLAIIVLLISLGVSIRQTVKTQAPVTTEAIGSRSLWQTYTKDRLTALKKSDDPIFINMTAAWCISCKVNERVALSSEDTKQLFAAHNVRYLKGDWTNQNPEITAFLKSYGRSGVPLYIFYGARNKETGQRPEPVVLPQILTPGLIKDMFEK